MKEIFEHIIKNRLWLEVPCGSGSTLAYTLPLRQKLPEFIERHGIKSMLDLPCGDYSWMSQISWSTELDYQGADIVDSMIHQNQNTYPDIKFTVLDVCQDPLPAVDLLFCRDCLFHLSHQDIHRALTNIAKSDILWLMTTTYPDVTFNRDIPTGHFRPINLTLQPYDLPEPIDHLDDWVPGHEPRVMALWSVDQLKSRYQ